MPVCSPDPGHTSGTAVSTSKTRSCVNVHPPPGFGHTPESVYVRGESGRPRYPSRSSCASRIAASISIR
ncbi:hypothetical protein ACFQHO_53130 [Actinomadura yumaensis]|uniref:hypothetical protein n=1 Tax=Actinomadura yumaensis TaxID=111807 RepID=UPI003608C26F